MADCQIKRSKYGDIETVLASNGKESIAYKSLLRVVESLPNKSVLQAYFSSWVGKHINNIDDSKELALALYKHLYSPAFKNWFGDWETMATAVNEFRKLNNVYGVAGPFDPEQSLFEIAQQANSSTAERNQTMKAVGEKLFDIAVTMFPRTLPGHQFTASLGKGLDLNNEPLIYDSPKEGPIYINASYESKSVIPAAPGNPLRIAHIQRQIANAETVPPAASAATVKKVQEFLDRIGADVVRVNEIRVNGNKLNANGVADAMRGLVMVVNGKEDVALTEEAMHLAVELIQQKNPVMFKSMMDQIGSYKMFDDVIRDYKNVPGYQTQDGKPDIPKLKKEAIAKVLAETIVNKNNDTTEDPAKLSLIESWWKAFLDWFKGLFLKAQMNPFEDVAEEILAGKENLGTVKDLRENNEFNQIRGNPDLVRATLRIIGILKEPNIEKIYDRLYSTNREAFYSRLNRASKEEIDMLRQYNDRNNPDSLEDMIVGLAAGMTYAVEIKTSRELGVSKVSSMTVEEFDKLPGEGVLVDDGNEFLDIQNLTKVRDGIEYYVTLVDGVREGRVHEYDPEGAPPTQTYRFLSVAGGTDYTENEIRTPDIEPAIKGHAAFATDKGIGWFRSDDKVVGGEVREVPIEFRDPLPDEQPSNLNEMIGNFNRTTTRRILEIQSDLFQKGRGRGNLIVPTSDMVNVQNIKDAITDPEKHRVSDYVKKTMGDGYWLKDNESAIGGFDVTDTTREGFVSKLKERLLKLTSVQESPENGFLQLLNKKGNWVTFFVKSIIQDSAKKGYEKVVFPSGNTANKIEGQTTVEEFIREKKERFDQNERTLQRLWKNPDEFSTGNIEGDPDVDTYFLKDGKYFVNKLTGYEGEDAMGDAVRKTEEITKQKFDTDREQIDKIIEREQSQLEREIDMAEAGAGESVFQKIASFYEDTIHNILKKQGYNPKRVKDDHNNEWFEINIDQNRDLSEFYYQLSTQDTLYNKVEDTNNNIAKVDDEYQVNGTPIRNTVEDEVAEYYKSRLGSRSVSAITQAAREFKEETESKAREDVKDILHRYIDDDGIIREVPLEQTNPSVLDPYNNTYYATLEGYIKDMLATYGAGTKFIRFSNIFDNKTNTVGTVDLLAIMPDGKTDILQFKAPDLASDAKDVAVYKQEAYNIEIEALRKILQNGYGVKRTSFRQTRAIPIKVQYEYVQPGAPASGLKVKGMKIGNANVNLIKDDVLLPIPSASETTGSDKFDRFISRLRALAQKLSKQKVSPDKFSERSRRVAALLASIRKLQIQHKAEGLISNAKGIISAQKGAYITLQDAMNNTDPLVASIEDLNKIAGEIMNEKDQVELYSDLYRVLKEIFTDNSESSRAYLKDAREISDDADDIVDQFWTLATKFRKEKLAARLGIKDEFNPEKQLTWYRRMVRSLSQSSIKAGAILWQLVKRINNRYELEFQDRLAELKKIDEGVEGWLKGKTVKDLYSKIFQIKDGKWNGRVIQKFSRDFYNDLRTAQEERNFKWVNENIDVEAYKAWFKTEHQRRIEESKTKRVHEDEETNKKLIKQSLQDFVDTFYIGNKKGVGPSNYRLKDYPREDKWLSEEYKELQKPENQPVMNLYQHWIKRLDESWREGIIAEHSGWSYFPNVRRNLLEKLTLSGGGSKIASFLGNLKIEAEDSSFGKIDPLTQRPIDEVSALYVSDLGQWVKGTDGNYFLDYSEKSMDIFKVLALWDREIIKYKLKTESENLAKLVAYTEEGQGRGRTKGAYKTTRTGKLERDKEGRPIIISNEINAKYVKEHIDAVWYGKHMSDESDVSITIPYKSAVQTLNKLFGRTIIDEPEQETIEVSGVKAIAAMNRFYVTKTLGLNVFTSLAQLFGGSINAYINQGIFIDKKDLAESEYQFISGKFWGSEEMKKMAGLLKYFHPYTDDKTREQVRNLSLSNWIKYLSSDHLFFMQRGADTNVNSVIAMAYIKNTMIVDGKLINIREYARKELGHAEKYSGTYEQAKEFEKRLDTRVQELKKSPDALINRTKIIQGKDVEIEGVDRLSNTNVDFRESVLKFIRDALGNTSREDLSLYKRSVMWQSFFMFKNWIPRMVDVRLQSLKYVPGADKYEWGRLRMLGQALINLKGKSVKALFEALGGGGETLAEVGKKLYQKKQQEFAEQEEDFDMTEAEFIDMFIKGVRSEFKELGLALGLISILFAARVGTPDTEDDPIAKGGYKWMLRGLDKLVDEVSFFYNPTSFTDIVNGSVFPAIGILVDIERFFRSGALKMFWSALGDEERSDAQHPLKYLLRISPITKELITYIAIFNADIAKEYGIRISSQNGSIR